MPRSMNPLTRRLLAAGLCAALLVGTPTPASALRVGQETTGLDELKAALPPASGLEERPLEGLRQAVNAWQRLGLLDAKQRSQLLNLLNQIVVPPTKLAAPRRQFLDLLGAFLEQLATAPRPATLRDARVGEGGAIQVPFRHEGADYVAAITGRELERPVLRIALAQVTTAGQARRPCGAAWIGLGKAGSNHPFLSLADSDQANPWSGFIPLRNVWSSPEAMGVFIQAFHRGLTRPLLSVASDKDAAAPQV